MTPLPVDRKILKPYTPLYHSHEHNDHCSHGYEHFEDIDLDNAVFIVFLLSIMVLKRKEIQSALGEKNFDTIQKTVGAGVGIPFLYHTVGHKIGLPHFPAEAYLGESAAALTALLHSNKEKALFYPKVFLLVCKSYIQDVINKKAPK